MQERQESTQSYMTEEDDNEYDDIYSQPDNRRYM